MSAEGAIPFNADEFTDPTELRSLAEMLGPYGIKLLNETLMWHIQSQVTELRKLVLLNKEILIALRTNFDKPEVMKELFKRLQNVDSVLQRMTIIGNGGRGSFRCGGSGSGSGQIRSLSHPDPVINQIRIRILILQKDPNVMGF